MGLIEGCLVASSAPLESILGTLPPPCHSATLHTLRIMHLKLPLGLDLFPAAYAVYSGAILGYHQLGLLLGDSSPLKEPPSTGW